MVPCRGFHVGSIRQVLLPILVLVLAFQAGPATARGAEGAEAAEPVDARSWIGRETEFEAALLSAEVVNLEPIGTGVTNPYRADVAGGGPIETFAWKPIKAGYHGGFFESYESEVAAYELDKLLGLGMVPVKVERRLDGESGAACMWVTPAATFGQLDGPPTPPAREKNRWSLQLIRAKMFDNLINNIDPNLGNWMVDPAWNIILIDHSRAFSRSKRMVHELRRADRKLWERMLALDEETLTEALGQWLSRAKIRSVLRRRDRMVEVIAALVEKHGERAVLVEAADEHRARDPLP